MLVKFENNWLVKKREHWHKGTEHKSIMRYPYIWNLTVGFNKCNERLILVNYDHYQTVGFRVWRSQNLVKVGQTRWYLINGPKTTRLYEIHIRILIIGIETYGDKLVLVKFENNWMIKLGKQSHKGTYVHHAPSSDLKSNRWIQRVQWKVNSSKLWSQSNSWI